MIIGTQTDNDELERIKKKFNSIDTDGDGYFSLDDYLYYLTQKLQTQTSVGAAIYNTKIGISKIKKMTKDVDTKHLKFAKTVCIKSKILSKNSPDGYTYGWKQYRYKPYYENNSIILKCFDDMNGSTRIKEYDMDFNKMKTSDVQLIEDNDKKGRYWITFKVSSLPHEYACSSQKDYEEWTQNIRYLHNRIAVAKAKVKAAEVSGLLPKESKSPEKEKEKEKEKSIDPALLEEIKSLDPFAPGKTKEEKEAIWTRINEIRDVIGDNPMESDSSSDNVKSESLSLSNSECEDSEKNDEIPKPILSPKKSMNALKRAASTTGRLVAEKTKVVAEKTKEKSDRISSKTAVSARALKTSVGHVTKNVVSKVKKGDQDHYKI